MAELIKLILALTVVTALAGLAIGITNSKTSARIAELQREVQEAATASVFPEGAKVAEVRSKGAPELPEKYWAAHVGGDLAAYAFEVSGDGYAGDVKFMVGVGVDGKILGITVLDHKETPGLGSRATEVPSSKYIWYPVGGGKAKPWFTEQFEGLSALKPISIDKTAGEWDKLDQPAREELRNRNAVTAITGSTITTKAFTAAIERKAAAYLKALGGGEPAVNLDTEAAEADSASVPSEAAAVLDSVVDSPKITKKGGTGAVR